MINTIKAGVWDVEQTKFILNDVKEYEIKKVNREIGKMKIAVTKDKERIKVEDGMHKGIISNAECVNKNGYDWVELTLTVDDLVKDDGNAVTIFARYNQAISPSSMLGKLISRVLNIEIDPETMTEFEITDLRGKKVSYLTVTEIGKDKIEYQNVLRDTVKARK